MVPEWDAASEIFSPSPLNILEGFFIISLDTLHGEFVNAGTVLKGDVLISEFLASVKVSELDSLVNTDEDRASAMSSPVALISSSGLPLLSDLKLLR